MPSEDYDRRAATFRAAAEEVQVCSTADSISVLTQGSAVGCVLPDS